MRLSNVFIVSHSLLIWDFVSLGLTGVLLVVQMRLRLARMLLLLLREPFTLSPFGSTILEPYLNSGFREVNPHGKIFPGEYIRIMRLSEGFLQFLKLLESESSAVPPLLPPRECIIMDFSVHPKRTIGVAWLTVEIHTKSGNGM